ncbi:ATP-binding protein [Streptomyces sp. NPDC048448]|uniref:ATP-binding protein n=1 Tax=unclassified Streptomyces TaxID=2593676 RepID=UPI002E371468|nr:ATP-binding protein [Streptomyces sp. NBC_01455]
MELQVDEVYDGTPSCVKTARLTTKAFLARVGTERLARIPADTVSGAQLVVSELVTNAVRHAEGTCGMNLAYRGGHGVEITVWDKASGSLTAREWDPDRPGGFGLEIVRTICGPLTITPTHHGKQICVRMPLPQAT